MIKRRSGLAAVHLALAAAACAWVITLGASSPSQHPEAAYAAEGLERDGRREAASVESKGAPHATGAQATQVEKRASAPSDGCIGCHTTARDPHPTPQGLSCADCHGGNGTATTKEQAHPRPRNADAWPTAANPHESYTLLNRERHEWIRFMNPSDLRVAPVVCGRCHSAIVRTVQKGSMVNSAQVYSTALYNNASVPFKDALFVENYTPRGFPQILRTIPPPTPEETRTLGILPQFLPLPRFETGQPGTILRAFERGGGPKSELGNPNREDVPGQPDISVSNRGFGTQGSVDPVILGAQKVRLNDPVLSFMGTNDSPGDYRNSGCASCHVIYANDRDPFNSGPYAKFGNRGLTLNDDPTISKTESGHPIRHEFTRKIPSSQCITCHVHNGNGFLNTYLGYMWWDQQTDGEHLYPKEQRNPTLEQIDHDGRFNPEEAASRGLWNDPKFLATVSEMNPKLRKAQFSDYHGHGWMFQKVYKRDRKGNFLDADGNVVSFDDPELFKKTVHLKDIHLERGMHCVDCHFRQDMHGTGKLIGDRRAAIEIQCQDCHGTAAARATLVTSGPASQKRDLAAGRTTPFGVPQFSQKQGVIIQRSMVEEGKQWTVPQVSTLKEPKAVAAHTMQRDGTTWGDPQSANLAHADSRMTCITCHSSWTTNCFGCHLAAKVNTKKPMLHNEGTESQVYASYNPEILRSDGYMLGIDGTIQGHKIAPVRSSSAVTFSVQNAQRAWVVNQAPTISAAGFTGNAFNTHVPHTVRGKETKQCTDCHVSASGNNNAWLASLMMLGSNQVNAMGRYIYVARGGDGVSAIAVTESEMPLAVYGSHLHSIAYPSNFAAHRANGQRLKESVRHGTRANQVQLYGEYLLVASGGDGFRVLDVANVGNKDFAQRIVSAPFRSQRMQVDTRNATGLAIGSPAPLDLKRTRLPINEEQPIAPLFGYAFVTDSEEGLVVIDINTLSDGIPTNNHLRRSAAFNPGGKLAGASSITIAGNYAYVTTPAGVMVVSITDPLKPAIVAEISQGLRGPRRVAVQFRYAFVTDADGLKVIDVTMPERPRVVTGAQVPLAQASGLYLARTYAYVAAGKAGLAIIDIERPEQPRLDREFTADGAIADARDVKVGMTNVALFAYVADGVNGLQVVELSAPDSVPGNLGFSPRPNPRLVGRFETGGEAIGISEGYRRDRAVDESGNQIAVFGRRGARPFNLQEMQKLFLRGGTVWTVSDEPPAQKRTPTSR
jgi:hypothetical protein